MEWGGIKEDNGPLNITQPSPGSSSQPCILYLYLSFSQGTGKIFLNQSLSLCVSLSLSLSLTHTHTHTHTHTESHTQHIFQTHPLLISSKRAREAESEAGCRRQCQDLSCQGEVRG